MIALLLLSGAIRITDVDGLQLLHVGKVKYVISDERPCKLGGFDVVEKYPPENARTAQEASDSKLLLKKHGKTLASIDLKQLQDEWITHEERWGGHAAVNQFKYEEARGGVMADLTQCVPRENGDCLGVLSFREMDQSFKTIMWQALVRIQVKPFSVEWVHSVAPSAGMFGQYISKPVFRFAQTWMCVNGQELDQLKPDGSLGDKWADLSKTETAVGLAGGRWYIGTDNDAKKAVFVATDLVKRKTYPLYSYATKPPLYEGPTLREGPNSFSPYLILSVSPRDPDASQEHFFTLRLPDGKLTRLQGAADQVAGPYVIDQDAKSVRLYSAATGKRVR